MRVAKLKKQPGDRENNDEKTSKFHPKIDKNRPKYRGNLDSLQKSIKELCMDTHFLEILLFGMIFGSPGGSKNRPKVVPIIEEASFWSLAGTILGASTHFYRYLLPCWVPRGFILTTSCGDFLIVFVDDFGCWLVGLDMSAVHS